MGDSSPTTKPHTASFERTRETRHDLRQPPGGLPPNGLIFNGISTDARPLPVHGVRHVGVSIILGCGTSLVETGLEATSARQRKRWKRPSRDSRRARFEPSLVRNRDHRKRWPRCEFFFLFLSRERKKRSRRRTPPGRRGAVGLARAPVAAFSFRSFWLSLSLSLSLSLAHVCRSPTSCFFFCFSEFLRGQEITGHSDPTPRRSFSRTLARAAAVACPPQLRVATRRFLGRQRPSRPSPGSDSRDPIAFLGNATFTALDRSSTSRGVHRDHDRVCNIIGTLEGLQNAPVAGRGLPRR